MRAIIYVRLSSHRGAADPSTSPERQEAKCRGHAASREWDVVRVVSDLDVSGSDKGLRLDRPGIREIRRSWGEADVLIVSKLDRLARNVVDFHRIGEEAAAHGVQVVAVDEGLDLTTEGGRFTATILAAFAEMEAGTIATRAKESQAELRRVGRFAGGVVPYGYATAPAPGGRGRILVPDPVEAAVVRGMAEMVLHGATTFRVAREHNLRQVPTRRGALWSRTSVIALLTGDQIIGRTTHKGVVVRTENGDPLQAFDPVLDRETWTRVRDVLGVDRERAKPGEGRTRQSDLLVGLLRCAECSARIFSRDARGKRRYRCATAHKGGRCQANNVDGAALNGYITESYLSAWGDRPRYERVTLTGPDAELDDVEAAIRDVLRAQQDADDDEVTLLDVRRDELRARRAALRAAPPRRSVLRPTGLTHRQEWGAAAGDLDRQRQLLAAVFISIRLRPAEAPGSAFDPSRVVTISRPPHVLGVSDDRDHRAGAPVVEVDLEGEPDWE